MNISKVKKKKKGEEWYKTPLEKLVAAFPAMVHRQKNPQI